MCYFDTVIFRRFADENHDNLQILTSAQRFRSLPKGSTMGEHLRDFLTRRGWLVWGLALFSAGYVPLLIMWWSGFGPRGQGYPGFFSFPSATWGDGLCLPVMAAALAWMNGRLGMPANHKVQIVAGSLGAAGGTSWDVLLAKRPYARLELDLSCRTHVQRARLGAHRFLHRCQRGSLHALGRFFLPSSPFSARAG